VKPKGADWDALAKAELAHLQSMTDDERRQERADYLLTALRAHRATPEKTLVVLDGIADFAQEVGGKIGHDIAVTVAHARLERSALPAHLYDHLVGLLNAWQAAAPAQSGRKRGAVQRGRDIAEDARVRHERIEAKLKAGFSVKDTAREVGVSEQTVYNVRKALNSAIEGGAQEAENKDSK